jgi:hypothetical protein
MMRERVLAARGFNPSWSAAARASAQHRLVSLSWLRGHETNTLPPHHGMHSTSRFGFDLSGVPTNRETAAPNGFALRGQLGGFLPSEADTEPETAELEGATPAQSGQVSLSPFRILFSMAQVANPGCRVPDGQSGAAKVAKYRVFGPDGPAGGVTVSERFTVIEDPYNVFGQIRTATYTTGRTGEFDDCYLVATTQTLPPDFKLKVEQNHMIGGQVASKQHITWTPYGVTICVFNRRGAGFADTCKRY